MSKSGSTLGQADLCSDIPPVKASSGQEGTTSCQDDLWRDVPPSRSY